MNTSTDQGTQASSNLLTPIQYAEAVRFSKPSQQTFDALGSVASIISLMIMSAVSITIYWHLINPQGGTGMLSFLSPPAATSGLAAWTWVPFLFTAFGATLGWVFELGLLVSGVPFQMAKNKFTRGVVQFRLLNIAPVTMAILFFVCTVFIQDPAMRMTMLYTISAVTIILGFALYFGPANAAIPAILLGTQILQIIIILSSGGNVASNYLFAQAILQFIALLIGTATPSRSTGFHLVSTLSAVMLYFAILSLTTKNANFSHQLAIAIPSGTVTAWALVAACIAGLVIAIKVFPQSYAIFRTTFTNSIWVPLYYKLVCADRFPDPFSLKAVYDKNKPIQTHLRPYYQAHPEKFLQNLSIPAVDVDNMEASVTMFKTLNKQALGAFKLISFLDRKMPQSNINIPIENKPRMEIWSDGSEYWPTMFTKKILGASLPNDGQMDHAPKPALETFKTGQLLAFLAESGIANPLLQPTPERGEGTFIIDFRWMQKYETKADYEPYGGVAYFKINAAEEKLELVSVIAPNTEKEISANPNDPGFRRAERLILATVYFRVISGKHLGEIHMIYNLIEVCMHNAFDVQGQWTHPFRSFLYLHFFSHELAEEITTKHLVQESAVFNQVFATTHDALISHLDDSYSYFEYGLDEDFESREALMTIPARNGAETKILPNACIKWELKYFKIWNKYATDLVDIIYPNDQAVKDDKYMQDFHKGLLEILLNGLPDRYDAFQTKKGVARFAADTIHHMVVRHQVYGTAGVRAALDPRISQSQVPRDTGTPVVDEWRSLAFVALATAKSRFVLLTGTEGKDFTYLLEGVEESLRTPMSKVFETLQSELQELEKVWTANQTEKDHNYDYFRPSPSELHTGAGY